MTALSNQDLGVDMYKEQATKAYLKYMEDYMEAGNKMTDNMMTNYLNKKDLHQKGVKDDSGKVLGGVIGDFGLALMEVGKIGTYGANKYTRGGWQSVPDGIQRYEDAMWRHLMMSAFEVVDEESGYQHELHMVWNALAKLELRMREENNNNDSNTSREVGEGISSTCEPALSGSVYTRGE